MCYVVYIGTSQVLGTSEWDESNPSFFIEALSTVDQKEVRKQFSMENVYYVGSHEGCGCGFAYDEEFDKGYEDLNQRKASVLKFNELLKDVLNKSGECEIFLCWGGDESEESERFEVVGSEAFSKGGWVKDKPTFYRVKS